MPHGSENITITQGNARTCCLSRTTNTSFSSLGLIPLYNTQDSARPQRSNPRNPKGRGLIFYGLRPQPRPPPSRTKVSKRQTINVAQYIEEGLIDSFCAHISRLLPGPGPKTCSNWSAKKTSSTHNNGYIPHNLASIIIGIRRLCSLNIRES